MPDRLLKSIAVKIPDLIFKPNLIFKIKKGNALNRTFPPILYIF